MFPPPGLEFVAKARAGEGVRVSGVWRFRRHERRRSTWHAAHEVGPWRARGWYRLGRETAKCGEIRREVRFCKCRAFAVNESCGRVESS